MYSLVILYMQAVFDCSLLIISNIKFKWYQINGIYICTFTFFLPSVKSLLVLLSCLPLFFSEVLIQSKKSETQNSMRLLF